MQAHPLKLKKPVIKIPKVSMPANGFALPKQLHREYMQQIDSVKHGFVIPAEKMITSVLQYAKTVNSLYHRSATVKKFTIRCITTILVIDGVLSLLLVARIFTPLSPAERASMAIHWGPSVNRADASVANTALVDPEGQKLLAALKNDGASVAVIGNLMRAPMSVPGRIISVDSDNLLTFEYADERTANKEASLLANQFIRKNPGTWDERAHIYIQGTLVIFYLGTNTDLIASLQAFSGNSIINNRPNNT